MTKVIVASVQHGGLTVMRALSKYNLHLIAMTHEPNDFGLSSKYISERAICPNPEDQRAFVDYLLNKVPEWEGAFIFECSDGYSLALSKYRNELSPYYKFATPDWEVVKTFVNKDETEKLAEELGIPHPNTFHPNTLEELNKIADRIIFPIIMKPVRSHEFTARFRKKMFIAENREELFSNFKRALDANQQVMVQEIIPGTDEGSLEFGFIYVNSKGEMSCEMYGVKLRQGPPMFGVMRIGRINNYPADDLRQLTHKILKHVNFRGFADIEFKRDIRDGQLKLIEVNPRVPANIQLLVGGGANIPWMIYQDLVHDNQIKYDNIPDNFYLIDMLADVRDIVFRDRGAYSFKSYYTPYFAKRKTFYIMSIRDPIPFFRLIAQFPAKGVRKLAERLRKNS